MNLSKPYSPHCVTAVLVLLGAVPVNATLPPVTSGLVAQYDADALVLVNGSPVATWNDTSGGFNDVTVVAGGSPTYFSSGGAAFNDIPVVRFDGNDYLTAVGTLSSGNEITIFALLNLDVTSSVEQGLVGNRGGGQGYYLGISSDANNRLLFGAGINPNTDTAGPSAVGAGLTAGAGGAFVLTGLRDSSIAGVFTNGLTVQTVSTLGGAVGGANPFTIGAVPVAFGGFMTGDFNEILVYDRGLTPAEQAAVEQYLIAQITAIPEPSTVMLFAAGSGWIWLRRRSPQRG